jgi:uncharacterized protein YijF (DUF1287 family)
MATEVDLQRLVVQMEASFIKYERQWQKAMGVTDANVAKTKAKFDGLEKVIGNAGSRTARGLAPVSLQTGNIAAQFQDIAVQLQAGQSPFTIALQQGTQLSAALGGGGLKGALSGLAAGFGALINPVSLTTIAVIALGGAAVQYFSTLIQDGKVSAEELKKQEDLIRRVADRWGDAVPALKAYVDQLDRVKSVEELNQATDIAIGDVYAELITVIRDQLRPELAAARIDIQQLGGDAQEIDALQAAFDALAKKAADGKAEGADLEAVIKLLSGSTVGTTSTMQALVGVLEALQVKFNLAADAARRLDDERRKALQQGPSKDVFTDNRAFIAEQSRLNGLMAEQLALETEIARVKADAERSDVVISEQQALDIARQRLAAEERRAQVKASDKSASKTAKDAEREREAVLQLINELEHEYDMLGLTAEQKAVANALRRAGAAATAAERDEITRLITATMEEQAQIDALNELMSELGNIGKAAIQGIVQALADGKIEASEFQDILGNVLGMAGNFFLNQAFGGLGGGGGGIIGALFGKRAMGGPVTAGQPYLVGERGPEMIVPSRSGYVVPNNQLGGMGGGISISIDARGAQMGVAEQIEAHLDRWARFKAPPLIRHHARTTMPENG